MKAHPKAKLPKAPRSLQQGTIQHSSTSHISPQCTVHPISALQYYVGNQTIQRLITSRAIRPKLTISQTNDRYEQEADLFAKHVMRMSDTSVQEKLSSQSSETAKLHIQRKEDSLGGLEVDNKVVSPQGSGQALPHQSRAFFEPRLGADLGQVRIHSDQQAADSAHRLNARAYTIGHNIVFGQNQYQPNTFDGKKLIAHELTHVLQQTSSSIGMVQRDLKAYNKSKMKVLPSYGSHGASSQFLTITAEAPGIRSALSALIAAGKIKEVQSSDGKTSWFAAQHHKNAKLGDIRDALTKAGYSKADKLAKAIYDIHGEFLYSNQKLTTSTLFGSRTHNLGEKIETQTHRSMTEWEIRQARRVFGNALDYAEVTIAEGSVSAKIASAGGYARTIGNVINFPTGGSRDMAFMIHELTHVWQYQTTGWTYAPKALWAQVAEGYGYTESGKTAAESLKDARTAGKTLHSYNEEQQGDILRDYYRRLRSGADTSAWDPFVNDINNR